MSLASQIALLATRIAEEFNAVRDELAGVTAGDVSWGDIGGDIEDQTDLQAALGVVLVWTGSAWPTLSSQGLGSFAGVITWDSSGDFTAGQPSEMRAQDNWLQAATGLLTKRRVSEARGAAGGTAPTVIGMAVPTATGTATAATPAATNVHTSQPRVEYAVTSASTSAVAGWRDATVSYYVNKGFTYFCRFGPSRGSASNSTRRFFVGLNSVTTAPTDAQPSGIADVLGVGADTADTNWQFMHRTASGTVVKSSTGFAKADTDNTNAYELTITCLPGATTAYMTFKRLSDGSVATYTTTTAIPASTTMLAARGWSSVGGTSSVVGISLMEQYVETNI